MDVPGFDSWQEEEQFRLSKASVLDIGLTLSARHWVPRAVSPEENLSRREAKLSLECVEVQFLTSDTSSSHTALP